MLVIYQFTHVFKLHLTSTRTSILFGQFSARGSLPLQEYTVDIQQYIQYCLD